MSAGKAIRNCRIHAIGHYSRCVFFGAAGTTSPKPHNSCQQNRDAMDTCHFAGLLLKDSCFVDFVERLSDLVSFLTIRDSSQTNDAINLAKQYRQEDNGA